MFSVLWILEISTIPIFRTVQNQPLSSKKCVSIGSLPDSCWTIARPDLFVLNSNTHNCCESMFANGSVIPRRSFTDFLHPSFKPTFFFASSLVLSQS